MKKALSIILALTLCVGCMFSITGCSGGKTDGKYKINGLLTDINNTKTHLNNSIENELESEQNNQSESTE